MNIFIVVAGFFWLAGKKAVTALFSLVVAAFGLGMGLTWWYFRGSPSRRQEERLNYKAWIGF